MKLISGSSNRPFADSLARKLGIEQIEVEITKFANDEKRVKVAPENIKGQNIIS